MNFQLRGVSTARPHYAPCAEHVAHPPAIYTTAHTIKITPMSGACEGSSTIPAMSKTKRANICRTIPTLT